MFKEFLTAQIKKLFIRPKSGRRPYIIYAPNYDHRSAGRRVLHKLCHLLNEAGETAYIYRNRVNWRWVTPRSGLIKTWLLIRRGAIAVYPEKVYGNPLKAQRVVRYILNTPGIHGGPKTYDPSEIKFYYGSHLLGPEQAGERVLTIPVYDTSVFFQDPKVKRDIEYLVYFGKHPEVPGFPRKQVITITKPSRQIVLGNMLRRAKKLICYDNNSGIAFEATLCGCPVVVIPDGSRQREALANSQFGLFGVAWGESPEEWEKALATLNRPPQILAEVTRKSELALARFIEITQN